MAGENEMIPNEAFEAAMAAGEPADPPEDDAETPAATDPPADPATETPETPETPAAVEPVVAEPVAPVVEPERTFTEEQVRDIVRGVLTELTAEPETPAATATPAEREAPAHIKAMIDSDDPGAQAYGKAALADYNRQEDRLANLEAQLIQQRTEKIVAEIVVEQNAVAEKYALPVEVPVVDAAGKPVLGEDGKPQVKIEQQQITEADHDKVANWLLAHPGAAAELSYEEATRLVYPNIVQRTKPSATPPTKPAGQDVSGRRVVHVAGRPAAGATVQATGAINGRAPQPPEKAPADETLEQAIDRGWRRLNPS